MAMAKRDELLFAACIELAPRRHLRVRDPRDALLGKASETAVVQQQLFFELTCLELLRPVEYHDASKAIV